jgi:hypothetical protein
MMIQPCCMYVRRGAIGRAFGASNHWTAHMSDSCLLCHGRVVRRWIICVACKRLIIAGLLSQAKRASACTTRYIFTTMLTSPRRFLCANEFSNVMFTTRKQEGKTVQSRHVQLICTFCTIAQPLWCLCGACSLLCMCIYTSGSRHSLSWYMAPTCTCTLVWRCNLLRLHEVCHLGRQVLGVCVRGAVKELRDVVP